MNTVTLSRRFQISVPEGVPEALGVVPGQKLAFIQIGASIRLVPQAMVSDLVGIARGANTSGLRDREDRAPTAALSNKRGRPAA